MSGAPATAADALADLPAPLWGPLLRAVRRAVDGVDRSELPAQLRPFTGWKPERLIAARPRRAVAQALATDSRLRESVGKLLDHDEAVAAAAEADPIRLADQFGDDTAAAALTAHGRWEALAVLAADAAERLAAAERVGAETTARRRATATDVALRKATDELAAVREERDAQRRRADAAEQRLRRALDDADRVRAELDGERREGDRLRERLAAERRRHAERLARAHRRTAQAEARARMDDARALRVAADLATLSSELQAAVRPPEPDRGPQDTPARGAEVPRDVPCAVPGRPCRLPAGIAEDDPRAVGALLQVPGLEVVVDGYNVTKDDAGMPHAVLADQRRWLVRVAAGVAARHRRRVTVVFDGSQPQPVALPSPRGVSVVFTSGDETADDAIVGLVAAAPDRPMLVVSSDREVRDDCADLGANTVPSQAFLRAVD